MLQIDKQIPSATTDLLREVPQHDGLYKYCYSWCIIEAVFGHISCLQYHKGCVGPHFMFAVS